MGKLCSILMGAVLLACGISAQAQGPYHVWITGWSDGCEKSVSEALTGLDRTSSVFLDPVTHSAVLKTDEQLTKGLFEEALALYGMHVLYVVRTTAEGDKVPLDPEDLPFPVLQDTGDPDQDNADYSAAKAAWIAAYPGLYQAYKDDFFTNAPEE